jgi:hypothetical protein
VFDSTAGSGDGEPDKIGYKIGKEADEQHLPAVKPWVHPGEFLFSLIICMVCVNLFLFVIPACSLIAEGLLSANPDDFIGIVALFTLY